ncbi:PTS sugar transporter subunit IIB [Bacillus sp. B1-b2]|uniref:PTS sugar transporter subunit IIB n=1 Tax=Bacillus sp. B1-b2 TaxID=2653201 RepID=UPI0012628FF2|nr:PTS sugar transporter subunit IIB [Bacillus sp. B1-b2]KAB7665053.1 PTS sugar transporter subunit IIB [Bacillus sp. B1-b2]
MAKKILLACAGGFSTSMLVERMKDAAIAKGLEVLIDACGESKVQENLPADIVILGPQMGHKERDVKDIVGPDIPVTTIDMMDYGMMDGEKVLSKALELMTS